MSSGRERINKCATALGPQTLTVWQLACSNLINCKYVWYLAPLKQNKELKQLQKNTSTSWEICLFMFSLTVRREDIQRRLQCGDGIAVSLFPVFVLSHAKLSPVSPQLAIAYLTDSCETVINLLT